MVTRGRVKNGVVVLDEGVHLPEGKEVVVFLEDDRSLTKRTELLVTPLVGTPGSAAAVLAALATSPQVPADWVDELEQLIAQGRRPPMHKDPFADEPRSPEGP
jgi:hypothetical protein